MNNEILTYMRIILQHLTVSHIIKNIAPKMYFAFRMRFFTVSKQKIKCN
jgi:hypothetical protein